MRHDGGDAETGLAVELDAGVQHQDKGVTIKGKVRTLVDDDAYEEWGASGALRIDPGVSGRGLALTVAPSWENAASATEQLWSARDAGALVPGGEFEAENRLETELGYGLRAPAGLGVVTPYTGLTMGDSGRRTLRFGARWSLTPETTLSLEATREERGGEATPSDALLLRASIRF